MNAVVTEIRKIREEKGFSQRFLAERTGLSQAGIAHMELGDTTPTLLFLLTVADALEVELHGIVGEILRGEAEG